VAGGPVGGLLAQRGPNDAKEGGKILTVDAVHGLQGGKKLLIRAADGFGVLGNHVDRLGSYRPDAITSLDEEPKAPDS
jgi:hypothetical protein